MRKWISTLAAAACLGAIGAATPVAAQDPNWYGQYFEPKQIRGLGGPVSASKPSITGKRSLGGQKSSQRKRPKGVQTASLGRPELPIKRQAVTGGGVSWVASSGCLASSLKSVIYTVASRFGSVRVNSTCRSASHNRRVGGAPKSYHLTGNAADFRVFGNVSAAYAALRSSGSVGGLKHYGGGLFHIDTGPRRSW